MSDWDATFRSNCVNLNISFRLFDSSNEAKAPHSDANQDHKISFSDGSACDMASANPRLLIKTVGLKS